MLDYPSTLPCPTLNTYKEGTSIVRTQFQYGTRQRRAPKVAPTMGYRVILTQHQYELFYKFWTDLNTGVDDFKFTFNFGAFNSGRCRFITDYTAQQLGGGLWEISSALELDLVHAQTNCTLVPSNTLTPDNQLLPAKCPNNP